MRLGDLFRRAAPAAEQRPGPPAAVRRAWPDLPPLQRVVGPPSLVTAPDRFRSELTSWQNPSFLGMPGHLVSADAPSGSVEGIARPAGPVPVQRTLSGARDGGVPSVGNGSAAPSPILGGAPLPAAQRSVPDLPFPDPAVSRVLPAVPLAPSSVGAGLVTAPDEAVQAPVWRPSVPMAPLPGPGDGEGSAPAPALTEHAVVALEVAGPGPVVSRDVDPLVLPAEAADPPDPAPGPVADQLAGVMEPLPAPRRRLGLGAPLTGSSLPGGAAPVVARRADAEPQPTAHPAGRSSQAPPSVPSATTGAAGAFPVPTLGRTTAAPADPVASRSAPEPPATEVAPAPAWGTPSASGTSAARPVTEVQRAAAPGGAEVLPSPRPAEAAGAMPSDAAAPDLVGESPPDPAPQADPVPQADPAPLVAPAEPEGHSDPPDPGSLLQALPDISAAGVGRDGPLTLPPADAPDSTGGDESGSEAEPEARPGTEDGAGLIGAQPIVALPAGPPSAAQLLAAPAPTPVRPARPEHVAEDVPAAPPSSPQHPLAQRLATPPAAAPAPPAPPAAASPDPAVAALGDRPLVGLAVGPSPAGDPTGEPPGPSASRPVQRSRPDPVARDEPAALPSVAQRLTTPPATAPAAPALAPPAPPARVEEDGTAPTGPPATDVDAGEAAAAPAAVPAGAPELAPAGARAVGALGNRPILALSVGPPPAGEGPGQPTAARASTPVQPSRSEQMTADGPAVQPSPAQPAAAVPVAAPSAVPDVTALGNRPLVALSAGPPRTEEGVGRATAVPGWTPVQRARPEQVTAGGPAVQPSPAHLSVVRRLAGPPPTSLDGPQATASPAGGPAVAPAVLPAVADLGNRPLVALSVGPPPAGDGPAPAVASAVAALGDRPIVLRVPAAWAPDAPIPAAPPGGGHGGAAQVSVPTRPAAGRPTAVDAGAWSAVAVAQRTTGSAAPPWPAERPGSTTVARTTGAGAPLLRMLATPADVGQVRALQLVRPGEPLPRPSTPVLPGAEHAAHPGRPDGRAWELLVLRQDAPAETGAGASEPGETGTAGQVGATEPAPAPESGPAAEPAGMQPAGASVQTLATPPAPGAPASGAPASTSPTDIDALVQRLFDPLVRLLKAELRLDRERVGHALDLRY